MIDNCQYVAYAEGDNTGVIVGVGARNLIPWKELFYKLAGRGYVEKPTALEITKAGGDFEYLMLDQGYRILEVTL